jgi:hypothetical protein
MSACVATICDPWSSRRRWFLSVLFITETLSSRSGNSAWHASLSCLHTDSVVLRVLCSESLCLMFFTGTVLCLAFSPCAGYAVETESYAISSRKTLPSDLYAAADFCIPIGLKPVIPYPLHLYQFWGGSLVSIWLGVEIYRTLFCVTCSPFAQPQVPLNWWWGHAHMVVNPFSLINTVKPKMCFIYQTGWTW